MYYNNVTLSQQPYPGLGFTNRQTDAEANYQLAAGLANADPRMNAKQYDRPGVSRGRGQYSYAAAKGAKAVADGAQGAEMARMQDAYSNAGLALGEQARQQDFGLALSGLQDSQYQNDYMNQMKQRQRMMDFTGNIFNDMLGGNVLGGLR